MRPNQDDPSGRFNVVVIEDDAVMRLVIGMLFEDDGRFRICWHAGSAERALRLAEAEERRVDLIILDDMLDGCTTGTELAPALHYRWPDASVVMFTADPERVPSHPPIVARVAKTAPELLLETARRIVDVGGIQGGGDQLAPRRGRRLDTTESPVPGASRVGRAGHGLSVLAGRARWAAVAAVLIALLAASGHAPPPPRLVADLAGFVVDLLPGDPPDRRPEPGSKPEEHRPPPAGPGPGRSGSGSDAGADTGADAGADRDDAPALPGDGRGGQSGDGQPTDRGVPAPDGDSRRAPAGRQTRSPGQAPPADTPPSTAVVPTPPSVTPPENPAGNTPGAGRVPDDGKPGVRKGNPFGTSTTVDTPEGASPRVGQPDPGAQGGAATRGGGTAEVASAGNQSART